MRDYHSLLIKRIKQILKENQNEQRAEKEADIKNV